MAKDKKMVEAITARDVDFAKWYTDIVKKAGLAEYSGIKGCVILLPHGYAIWEQIQKELDLRLKATGHENVYFPMFIPESLLQKEKDHVEGFAPEVAMVTHGGSEQLAERLCLRPTSEVLFCEYFANAIQSHRDLPKKFNQWANIVRWEKTTRPFLRTTEFLWQEGHTAHATAEEAMEHTLAILHLYADFCEDFLALPVLRGLKTDKEKFAGARQTFTIESLMHDGQALQTGTTHNFGDGFARAFGIQYTNKENKLEYVHQTSWGLSTRLIGAVIMTHGDDNGLVLPPKIAPIQVAIIPVQQHKEGVLDTANALKARLDADFRVKIDDRDYSPGWKFAEYEMRGVPIRLEIGPKDIEAGQCVLVRRDNREKTIVPLENLEQAVATALEELQKELYEAALRNREERTDKAASVEELKAKLDARPGFIEAAWCGSLDCEDAVKEQATATSRLIPLNQEKPAEKCFVCGGAAECMVVWGRAY
ncbi:MAG: proline--tRNA ligase [Clostridiales bacterium]|jgi:prolyl-tRNA synthetase|nr:proline--tRNA ligase [Clostridiales bacterium]